MTEFEFEEAVRALVDNAIPGTGDGKSWIVNGRMAVLSSQDGIAYIHRHVPGHDEVLADGSLKTFRHDILEMPVTAENVERVAREIVAHLLG